MYDPTSYEDIVMNYDNQVFVIKNGTNGSEIGIMDE